MCSSSHPGWGAVERDTDDFGGEVLRLVCGDRGAEQATDIVAEVGADGRGPERLHQVGKDSVNVQGGPDAPRTQRLGHLTGEPPTDEVATAPRPPALGLGGARPGVSAQRGEDVEPLQEARLQIRRVSAEGLRELKDPLVSDAFEGATEGPGGFGESIEEPYLGALWVQAAAAQIFCEGDD